MHPRAAQTAPQVLVAGITHSERENPQRFRRRPALHFGGEVGSIADALNKLGDNNDGCKN
jgi:hypothetical protein